MLDKLHKLAVKVDSRTLCANSWILPLLLTRTPPGPQKKKKLKIKKKLKTKILKEPLRAHTHTSYLTSLHCLHTHSQSYLFRIKGRVLQKTFVEVFCVKLSGLSITEGALQAAAMEA